MPTVLKTLSFALIFATTLPRIVSAETIYFLVAEPPGRPLGNDSYVLPLSKQEDIDHARYLISLGQSVFLGSHAALVVAKVGPGKDGINRDYVDHRFPEWSWHVVEFRGFGDRTIEVLDGAPSYVENDPDWYLGNDGRQGLIGFWNYTVVRELGPMPLYLSVIPEGQNLQFYWSGVGTNYVYTLEGKESLASTNWLAFAGAAWPLKTNHWALPLANTSARFYRVRAESPILNANFTRQKVAPDPRIQARLFGTGSKAESTASRPPRRFSL
ncbi:MAG: hypothetical protein DME24_20965 [Verrucomicrobia bacterium]|nr:MAG: hypothetical protein DME24_20965 [Verrucomicrobiota bacterium]